MAYKNFNDISDVEKHDRCKSIFWNLRAHMILSRRNKVGFAAQPNFIISEILRETERCQKYGFDFELGRKMVEYDKNRAKSDFEIYYLNHSLIREEVNKVLKSQDPLKYYLQRFREITDLYK